jgi:hypothetical protein
MQSDVWTYGAEHEWADWPLSRKLPPGFGRDLKDITIVNSNGIANDPTGKMYGFGGEINTPPTEHIDGQIAALETLKTLLPEATVNYRSNLHLHIRVPGLINDLAMLKQLQRRIHSDMPRALPIIEPLELPFRGEQTFDALNGYNRRKRRMRTSHQTLLREERVLRQLNATTIEEFFEAEVPRSKTGAVMWHAQPRLCVNLRQLRETDTIEFRHWPGTMNPVELRNAFEWCRSWLACAINDSSIDALLEKARSTQFPKFLPYDHKLESRYRMTVHDGTVPKEEIARNIIEWTNK